MQTMERPWTVSSPMTGHQSLGYRCKDLLLGPPQGSASVGVLQDLFAALNRLNGVNVCDHPPSAHTIPPAHEFAASRHARRHPDLGS
jgi:hypothetical protein